MTDEQYLKFFFESWDIFDEYLETALGIKYSEGSLEHITKVREPLRINCAKDILRLAKETFDSSPENQ